jgi:hypothetical protein
MSKFLQFFARLKEISNRSDRDFILRNDYTIVVIPIPENGIECLNITSVTQDTITINALNKCDDTSGTNNMYSVIQSAWEVGYKNITLTDASHMIITFPNKTKMNVSIKKLNVLATGNTWYGNAFGFTNDAITEKYTEIVNFIDLSANELLEKLKGSKKQIFERDLIQFNEFNGIEPGDRSMSIIEIFNKIKEEFRSDADNHSNINKYTFYKNFVNKCYDLLRFAVNLSEDDMTYFTLSNPNLNPVPKKGGTIRRKRTKGVKKNKRKSRRMRIKRNKSTKHHRK